MNITSNTLTVTLAGGLLASLALAQNSAPEIKFDSVPSAIQLPAGLYLGEVAGVATNSKGDMFVYTRTGHPTVTIGTMRPFAHGGSRMFQFDRAGKYVREIGKDTYGFMTAAQVRVDPADNIWAVDEMSNMVMKFDPEGRVAMLLGRKAESEIIPPRVPGGDGAGQPTDLFNRPTDVAWDAAGNIFVADGAGNARIAKFDKDGKFIKSWGKRGAGPGEFANVLSIAVDAQGNVYAGDGGNKRIQVFDNNGVLTPRTQKVTSSLTGGWGFGGNRVRIDSCRMRLYVYDRCHAPARPRKSSASIARATCCCMSISSPMRSNSWPRTAPFQRVKPIATSNKLSG